MICVSDILLFALAPAPCAWPEPGGVPPSCGFAPGWTGGMSYMPTATSRVKSGVTMRSVTRMRVRPHVSLSLPSASCWNAPDDDKGDASIRNALCATGGEVAGKRTQRMILRSSPPEMKPEPSGSHASAVTTSVCWSRTRLHAPVYAIDQVV